MSTKCMACLGIILCVWIGCLGLPATSAAASETVASSLDKFAYQPDKIKVGTVYHYIKSNIDGTKPANVAVYIASPERIEVFKIYPGWNATYFVTADFDWSLFSPRKIESFENYRDGSRVLVHQEVLSPEKNLIACENEYSIAVKCYPVHNYNFDLISLNYIFRHLVNPETGFEVGITCPKLSIFGIGKLEFVGKALIKYIAEENLHHVVCRKYSITGAGIKNRTGTIWVNKEFGHVEKIEIPLRDNPAFKNFRFELQSIETMSFDGWNNYMSRLTEDYFRSAL